MKNKILILSFFILSLFIVSCQEDEFKIDVKEDIETFDGKFLPQVEIVKDGISTSSRRNASGLNGKSIAKTAPTRALCSPSEMLKASASSPSLNVEKFVIYKYYKSSGSWEFQESIEVPFSDDIDIINIPMADCRFAFEAVSPEGKIIYFGVSEKDFTNVSEMAEEDKVVEGVLHTQLSGFKMNVSSLLSRKIRYIMQLSYTLKEVDYVIARTTLPVTTSAQKPVYAYESEGVLISKTIVVDNDKVTINDEAISSSWITIEDLIGKGAPSGVSLVIDAYNSNENDSDYNSHILHATLDVSKSNLISVGSIHNLRFNNISAIGGNFEIIDNDEIFDDITVITPEDLNLKVDNVAYWNMAKATGSLVDNSDNGNNLVAHGNLVYGANKIDTERGYMSSILNNKLDFDDGITISMWIKQKGDSYQDRSVVFTSKSNGGDNNLAVVIRKDNSVNLITRREGGGSYTAYGCYQAPVDKWLHFVLKVDKVTDENGVRCDGIELYVNNMFITRLTNNLNIDWSNFTMTFSGQNQRELDSTSSWGGKQYFDNFNGYIRQCGIWKRLLKRREIWYLYNSGNGLNYENFPTEMD